MFQDCKRDIIAIISIIIDNMDNIVSLLLPRYHAKMQQ